MVFVVLFLLEVSGSGWSSRVWRSFGLNRAKEDTEAHLDLLNPTFS